MWEIRSMKTLTVDDQNRIRLPGVRPRQVFAYAPEANGTIRLQPVKARGKEPFPRGSLSKFITRKREAEVAALARGSSLQLPA